MRNILSDMETHLPEGLMYLLREIGDIAHARNERAYLVGGAVRDILLKRPSFDLDVVIEGRAIPLAQQIAEIKGWQLKKHPRFGTATLSSADFHLDLATARSETYEKPGALPVVQPGHIEDDLARRDFTINAMAASLDEDTFGILLDPHDGYTDLEHRLIRVLHSGSFVDDPTRILRAIRYEQRLDFTLEAETQALLHRDASRLATVTVERIWHEMELILSEDRPERVLQRADNLRVLPLVYPAFHADQWLVSRCESYRQQPSRALNRAGVYLALLVYRLNESQAEDCITRIKMPGWATKIVRDEVRLKRSLNVLSQTTMRPSTIYHTLKHHIPEVIQAVGLAVDDDTIRQRMFLFLDKLRHISPSLNGADLHRFGIKPNKRIGDVLNSLHDAKLDGKVRSREDEEIFVRQLFQQMKNMK